MSENKKDLWLVVDYLAMSQTVRQIHLVRAADEQEAREQGRRGCLVVNIDKIPDKELPFPVFIA